MFEMIYYRNGERKVFKTKDMSVLLDTLEIGLNTDATWVDRVIHRNRMHITPMFTHRVGVIKFHTMWACPAIDRFLGEMIAEGYDIEYIDHTKEQNNG